MDHAARDAGNYYSERNLSPQKGTACAAAQHDGLPLQLAPRARLRQPHEGDGRLGPAHAAVGDGAGGRRRLGRRAGADRLSDAVRDPAARALPFVASAAPSYRDDGAASDGSAATSSHGRSWEKISEAAFGAPGVAISLAFLVSAQLGVCASYLAFFATQLHDHGLFSSVRVAVLAPPPSSASSASCGGCGTCCCRRRRCSCIRTCWPSRGTMACRRRRGRRRSAWPMLAAWARGLGRRSSRLRGSGRRSRSSRASAPTPSPLRGWSPPPFRSTSSSTARWRRWATPRGATASRRC